ncbi:MAG: hypothetical protein H6746_19660 [Deltaproteobacteria bacterium]|nr:hypothetical protein [Deltaproteobacteria bacterium]
MGVGDKDADVPHVELEALALEGYRSRAALDDDALDDLFERVARTTVDHRPSLRDRLRELRTPVRVALSVLLAVGLAAAVLAVVGIAPSVAQAGAARFAVAIAMVVGFMALAVATSLRGVHRRGLSAAAWALALVTLAAPLALSVIPGLWGGRPAPHVPSATPTFGLYCFRIGIVSAVLVGFVIRLFQRVDRPTSPRLIALAAAGGLVAFGSSQLYCPSDDLVHVTIGHGLVGVALAILLLGGAWVARALRR